MNLCFLDVYINTAYTIRAMQKHQKIALENITSINITDQVGKDSNRVNILPQNLLMRRLCPELEGTILLMPYWHFICFPSHVYMLLL